MTTTVVVVVVVVVALTVAALTVAIAYSTHPVHENMEIRLKCTINP